MPRSSGTPKCPYSYHVSYNFKRKHIDELIYMSSMTRYTYLCQVLLKHLPLSLQLPEPCLILPPDALVLLYRGGGCRVRGGKRRWCKGMSALVQGAGVAGSEGLRRVFRIRHPHASKGALRCAGVTQTARNNAAAAAASSSSSWNSSSLLPAMSSPPSTTFASSVRKVGLSSGLVPPISSWPCMEAILASSWRFSS